MKENLKHISKLLSLVLRHQPEKIGLELNENGWANVAVLLEKLNTTGNQVDFKLLQELVEENDKKRFAFNDDKTMIRASQGHSIHIELNLESIEPPELLYHGTVNESLEVIRKEGIKKMSRQHVHLSTEKETATKVAIRRGKPIILTVSAHSMHTAGYKFFLSANHVWLTEEVPPQFIEF